MNFPFFIAKKIAFTERKSFSAIILKISMIAVAISLAVMIITTATVRGFKNQISEKIFGLWGQIHVTDASINQALEAQPIDRNQPFIASLKGLKSVTYLKEDKRFFRGGGHYVEATTEGGVRHVQVFATKPGIIKTKTDMEGIVLKGAGDDFDWQFMQQNLLEGRPIQYKDATASRDIIVSQFTANRLNIKVNDKFVVHFLEKNEQIKRAFTVCGIYKTGLEEYDKKIAFADLAMVQELLGWQKNQVAGFEIFVENYEDIAPLTEHIYNEVLPNTLYAQTIKEKFPSIFEWLDLQDINEVVIVTLMTIVAIINMMTALLILILERTEMTGILKALGTNNWTIRKIFLTHAAIIAGVGLLFGNIFGIGICLLQEKFKFIKLSEADYYLSYAPVELHFPTIVLLNLLTIAIIVFFLIFPTYLITKISPVKAIRLK
jgi:lipoprotein-releasing system permease protein